ncbi:hypothetical protein GOV14_05570 [Candidatus Pacearchaeota archaeon]|nr:hypothetical protein [Candidatus Pacearchaeota archaeon]
MENTDEQHINFGRHLEKHAKKYIISAAALGVILSVGAFSLGKSKGKKSVQEEITGYKTQITQYEDQVSERGDKITSLETALSNSQTMYSTLSTESQAYKTNSELEQKNLNDKVAGLTEKLAGSGDPDSEVIAITEAKLKTAYDAKAKEIKDLYEKIQGEQTTKATELEAKITELDTKLVAAGLPDKPVREEALAASKEIYTAEIAKLLAEFETLKTQEIAALRAELGRPDAEVIKELKDEYDKKLDIIVDEIYKKIEGN